MLEPGACRGVVFGGGITPDLTAPGVTPDLTAPPKILTAPPYFEASQNYRFFYNTYYPLLLVLRSVRRVSFDLVNYYFLTAPGKMRK